jgi:hypothetical protein
MLLLAPREPAQLFNRRIALSVFPDAMRIKNVYQIQPINKLMKHQARF